MGANEVRPTNIMGKEHTFVFFTEKGIAVLCPRCLKIAKDFKEEYYCPACGAQLLTPIKIDPENG